jgi:hypothetical protein
MNNTNNALIKNVLAEMVNLIQPYLWGTTSKAPQYADVWNLVKAAEAANTLCRAYRMQTQSTYVLLKYTKNKLKVLNTYDTYADAVKHMQVVSKEDKHCSVWVVPIPYRYLSG